MYNDIVVVTFSGTDVHRKLQKEFTSLYRPYFHSVEEYTMEEVKESAFYFHNQKIFNYKKYSGYFLWKPYIILDAMHYYPDKMVLYADSNLRFKNLPKFYEKIKEYDKDHFFIGHHNYINKDWTKRDTFILMDADTEYYWNANQIWSSLMGFKTRQWNSHLLDLYSYYCTDERIITDIPNECGKPNLDGFVAHRWEQSIMSILVKRYDFQYIWDYEVIPHILDKIYPEELMELKKNGF